MGRKFDGIICGHIHQAELKEVEGLMYLNCGDWVESMTAIVENYNGIFNIITWDKVNENKEYT